MRTNLPSTCLVAGRATARQPATCLQPIRSEQTYVDLASGRLAPAVPAGDRLILLNNPVASVPGPPYEVVYDSQGSLASGAPAPMDGLVANDVAPRPVTIDGRNYLVAAVASHNAFVKWLLLATPEGAAQALATQQLVPRILISAGAALLLAILVTLFLARAFTRPLNELKTAAEDIAAGNYGTRVNTTAYDEVALVGLSFNRMAEAVERSRRLQREFLANASHELKTPLTSLIGFSQALMDGSLQTDEEKRRAATILHEESQRVLRLSQELLDLARVESGQLRIEPQPVDLGALLQQEIDIVRQRGAARRLTLELAVQAWLPPVHADPERLHQILENLLDNAVKYAPEGTDVWLSAEHMAGGRVRTTVRNRVGAHAPNPDRMFDRFYRADPSRASGARSGVGLGLAISRELAVAQRGSLEAELDQHGQISLRLDLPAAAPPPAASGEETWTRPVRLPPGLPEARPT